MLGVLVGLSVTPGSDAAAAPESATPAAAPTPTSPMAAAPTPTSPLPPSPSASPAAAAPLGHADRIHGAERNDLVAFTFDDGPAPRTTPLVLDALARYHVPGTFFVVTRHIEGSRAAAGLPVLARAVAEGHVIGCHTARHARLGHPTPEILQREVDDSLADLRRATGSAIELFRPPYGVLGAASTRRVQELGLTDVRWSIDRRDFDGKDAAELRRSLLADIVNERGGVVLLHDTKRITAMVLSSLLDDLERTNCRRIARGVAPILPVSLHYFLHDQGHPRAVPPEVQARTEAYRGYLAQRCEAHTSAPPSTAARSQASTSAASARQQRPGAAPRRRPRRSARSRSAADDGRPHGRP
jgi:peptidoglycan/xylan/chitin deacetylase (PgdA/CDA1 family)